MIGSVKLTLIYMSFLIPCILVGLCDLKGNNLTSDFDFTLIKRLIFVLIHMLLKLFVIYIRNLLYGMITIEGLLDNQ
ncbi:hypothetical protein F4776DRAFT_626146 [Hypoxylon sp. NC0597]|nr:hypothetical protein F4776DRAFT_626146 [Hypoxylon sp. NC0597]